MSVVLKSAAEDVVADRPSSLDEGFNAGPRHFDDRIAGVRAGKEFGAAVAAERG